MLNLVGSCWIYHVEIVEKMSKLVVCIIAYNEECTITDALKSALLVKPDAIQVFDGAWKHGGPVPDSTDRTETRIEIFASHCEIPISFHECGGAFFEDQASKRNQALISIREEYGSDTWVLILDGDEEIILPYGPREFDLKKYLEGMEPIGLGTIRAYAFGEPESFVDGLRLFHLGKKVHYYTEKTMTLHDEHCNTIQNYDPERPSFIVVTHGNWSFINIKQFHIVNAWMNRTQERLRIKDQYYKFRTSCPAGPCQFRKRFY